MTRFIHDQFSKDYLEEILSPYGKVTAPFPVSPEAKEIDLCFIPGNMEGVKMKDLGLLGRLALAGEYPSLFEPFRNQVGVNEICACVNKLLDKRQEELRASNRKQGTPVTEEQLPKMWILSPTASAKVLSRFKATVDYPEELPGVYFLPEGLRTAVVVIHQLPRTRETLWLRLLGRDKVQEEAISELEGLEASNPFRSVTLNLLYNLQKHLELREDRDTSDRELIMRLTPLYEQEREQTFRQGQRLMLENLLRARFGSLEPVDNAIIETLLTMPPSEFTPLLLQLSREELIARFGQQN